jgi:anaerobic magnesium-protoporphyrin IX monomethyl ester cyclase
MKAVIEMHVVLATLNAKYIHKNLALRWLFVSAPVDFDVRLVEGVIKDDPLNTAKRIIETRPDVIGLSVYIFNAEETKRLIVCLQDLSPLCRIILGGPEVTYNPGPWLDLGVEAVVCGEGEEVFWSYLQGTSSQSIATHNSAATEVAQVKLELLEKFDSPYFLEADEADMEKRYRADVPMIAPIAYRRSKKACASSATNTFAIRLPNLGIPGSARSNSSIAPSISIHLSL